MMDRAEALRCIEACADYLAKHDESPRAAKDLRVAVKLLISEARGALLKKYMRHVLDEEGTTFIRTKWAQAVFTAEEYKLLRAIDEEI